MWNCWQLPSCSRFAYILLLAWSPAMAIDEPGYTIIRTYDAFEVRRYESYVVAETIVNAAAEEAGRSDLFRMLSREEAQEAIISETTMPAPNCLAVLRNGRSVTPDMGARMTGVSIRTPLPRSIDPRAGCVVCERQLPMIWAG